MLSQLQIPENSRKKRKRLGRGHGSTLGKTSGRGHKGQNSRSGGGVRVGFEGGQLPIYMRLPKRGFFNPFRVKNLIVNLDTIVKNIKVNVSGVVILEIPDTIPKPWIKLKTIVRYLVY